MVRNKGSNLRNIELNKANVRRTRLVKLNLKVANA